MSQHSAIIYYEDLTFEIDVDYSPGDPGKMYMANGDPGWPPEPEEWDVTAVRLFNPDDKKAKPVDVTSVMTNTMMDFFNEEAKEAIPNDEPDERY